MKMNLITTAAVLLLIIVFALHPPVIVWSAARIIGAILAVISMPLVLLARWQLGASFSVTAQARSLVTTGLYYRIRNPIYLFGGIFAAGVSLFLSPWGPLVVAAILIPLQLTRAASEERVLTAAFGDEYRRYKASTWF